jgi:hypothetical protein
MASRDAVGYSTVVVVDVMCCDVLMVVSDIFKGGDSGHAFGRPEIRLCA